MYRPPSGAPHPPRLARCLDLPRWEQNKHQVKYKLGHQKCDSWQQIFRFILGFKWKRWLEVKLFILYNGAVLEWNGSIINMIYLRVIRTIYDEL